MTEQLEDSGGAIIDALLEPCRSLLGADWLGYRNHCRRTFAFTLGLSAVHGDEADCLATAIAFHDLGVWTSRSLDYLEPSVDLAMAWADQEGRAHWRSEMAAISATTTS